MKIFNNWKDLFDEAKGSLDQLSMLGRYDSGVITLEKRDSTVSESSMARFIEIVSELNLDLDYKNVSKIDYKDFKLVIKHLGFRRYVFLGSHAINDSYISVFLSNISLDLGAELPADKPEIVMPEKLIHEEIVPENLLAARRLQRLAIGGTKVLENYFKSHYLFFKPQNIIGGDFYFFKVIENKLFVIVGDCTGHDIEGALASVSVISILNQLNFQAEKLDQLLVDFYDAIEAYNGNDTGDGFYGLGAEMAVARFDLDSGELDVVSSGVFFAIKSSEAFRLYKPSSKLRAIRNRQFDVWKLSEIKNCSLYFYSDGLPDQFGNDDSRKLGHQKIEALITDPGFISGDKSFSSFWENWIGENEQTDDVTFLSLTT